MNFATVIIASIFILFLALISWRRRRISSPASGLAIRQPVPRRAMHVEDSTGTVEITRFDDGCATCPLPLRGPLTGVVEGLIRTIPSALAFSDAAGGRFLLTFSPGVLQRLRDGSASVMRAAEGGLRAHAIDASGAIVGQGRLLPAAPWGSIAGAAWQAMAVITAQKFLADIEARLAGLTKAIGGLQRWLEEDRIGKLRGNLAFLAQLVQGVVSGAATPHDLALGAQQVEEIEREALQVFEGACATLGRLTPTMAECTLSGQGLFDHYREACTITADFERTLRTAWLALRLRGVALQVRGIVGGELATAAVRGRDLRQAARRLRRMRKSFLATLERRIPHLYGAWSWDSTDARLQSHLKVRSLELGGLAATLERQVRAPITQLAVEVRRQLRSAPALVVRLDGARRVVGLEAPMRSLRLRRAA